MSDLIIGKGGSKRYVATFTCYVYANDDQQALNDANEFSKLVNNHNDNEFEFEEMIELSHGSLAGREINVEQYKLDL